MSRPRTFDVDTALTAALHVFWKAGFEGATLTELTDAMGINKPSLYATFGNKETLFHRALDHYNSTCMSFFDTALAEPTARGVAERLLFDYADAQTRDAHPPGCLTTNSALACSEAAEPIRLELIARRNANEALLCERLRRAQHEGDLAADADAAALANYLMTVVQGMSVQAASGAQRNALHAVARMAIKAWPA